MMIDHSTFARYNTVLSHQNACLLRYNVIKEGLVEILLDQVDRANKVFPIICVFAQSYDR